MIAALVVSAMLQAGEPPRGLFLGDELRYQRDVTFGPWLKGLVVRTFADVVSIPSTAIDWSPGEWALASAVLLPTAAAWVPIDGRSLDARLQAGLHDARGANCETAPAGSTVCEAARSASFHLWTPTSNLIIGATEVVTPLLVLAAGALFGQAAVLEASTLAVEAWFVAQLYHVGLKLLTGREGVLAANGGGRFFGPTQLHFPDGFPSGHAASLFAIIGAYTTYLDAPWLYVVMLGVGLGLATWLVLDDYHFASEVFFGAASGFLIGRWVVKRRASKAWYEPVGVTPTVSAQGGGLTFTWALPADPFAAARQPTE